MIEFLRMMLRDFQENQEKGRVLFSFEDRHVGFIYSLFTRIVERENTIWIVPDSFFYEKRYAKLTPIFLGRKQASFCLYERRVLKTKSGLYPLPKVKISGEVLLDLSNAKKKELFPGEKNRSFYLAGDMTDRLQDSRYFNALKQRQEQDPKALFWQDAYQKAKKKLDKRPFQPFF